MERLIKQIRTLLYEVAMTIGTSLDLRNMLKQSLSTLLRKMNCSAGGVYMLRDQDSARGSFDLVFSIPRNISGNVAFQKAVKNLPDPGDKKHSSQISDMLPITGQIDGQSFYYILELPSFGLIVLLKNGEPLDPLIVTAIKPLLVKLGEACHACLQGEALASEKERLAVTLRSIGDGVITTDTAGRINVINRVAEQLTGWTQEEAVSMPLSDVFRILDGRTREPRQSPVEEILQGRSIVALEGDAVLVSRDGGQRMIADSGSPILDGSGNAIGVVLVFRDITDQKAADEELRRTNRAMQALSACNQALVRASEESALLNDICGILVDVAGFRLAWVGFAEQDEAKTVRSVAQAGYEEGYLETTKITWADTDRGRGPTGTAIRTGLPQTVKNILSDPLYWPWREEAIKRGYASSIALPLAAEGKIFGALNIYAAEPEAFDKAEVDLLMELADDMTYGVLALRTRNDLRRANEELQHNAKKYRDALDGAIKAMAMTVEMRDHYTAGHQERVTDLACAIAGQMGISDESLEAIKMAGPIHDLGKLLIPAEILSKTGKLNNNEIGIIKTHPQAGYDILKEIEFPWPLARIVLQHHERMDGSGYPLGLKGDEILIEARILGVADVVETMASHRPYRPAIGLDSALGEIRRNKGSLYDPAVVDACLHIFEAKRFEFGSLEGSN